MSVPEPLPDGGLQQSADSAAGPPRHVARVLQLLQELAEVGEHTIEGTIAWLTTHRPQHAAEYLNVLDCILAELYDAGTYSP